MDMEKGPGVIPNKVEAIGATASSAASMASCLAEANAWLQLAVGLATLAWWIRIWIKNPNVKPPNA